MLETVNHISLLAQTTADRSPWWDVGRSLGFAAMFGLLGIILAIFAYKLFDWVSPLDVEKELGEKRNIAVAIVMAGFLLGVCIIISRAIGS